MDALRSVASLAKASCKYFNFQRTGTVIVIMSKQSRFPRELATRLQALPWRRATFQRNPVCSPHVENLTPNPSTTQALRQISRTAKIPEPQNPNTNHELFSSSNSKWVVVKMMVPFGGTLNIRCRIIVGTQKGTIILTTT